jgi:acetoacetate decarboxylase
VWATTLVATYLTDPEVIAAVLPPPIEPGSEPLVKVTVATVDIPGYPTFGAGSFSVRARHEGTDGFYALLMPMTTEQSVIGGRETFGEPKKLGSVELTREGDLVTGTFARMGVEIVKVSGQVTGVMELPDTETRTDFYFKFLPSPDGKGFDTDPSLVYCHRTEQTRKLEAVTGEVLLRDSRFDPVADLPVRELVGITLAERSSVQRGEIHGTVPGEWIRPYVHQRYDDMSPVGEQ